MTDRLDAFKAEIQWQLERDRGRVGELAVWCKQWPSREAEVNQEQMELEESIPRLRYVLACIDDWTREHT